MPCGRLFGPSHGICIVALCRRRILPASALFVKPGEGLATDEARLALSTHEERSF
jgi:hypothetical protein